MARKPKMMVKVYKNNKAYQRDIKRMARKGWMVLDTTSEKPRAGLGRIALLGPGALVYGPRSKVIVTYQKGE